jgi:GH35 family endo-1,4-beta-xylanase/C-terminal processing protease CtpA/Prc
LKGSKEWAEYSISLPVHPDAKQVFIGFLLGGSGKAWVDDMRLLVDGKPLWDVPVAERPKTALDLDHEYDGGSGTLSPSLSRTQIENLTTLGKVWGFLKYHHPIIIAGKRHWDYDLFRVLPAILAAKDRRTANAALVQWIGKLGPVEACKPCASLEKANLHFGPRLNWLGDAARLGTELSKTLQEIHRNRIAGKQFYLSLTPGVGNPAFENEPGYQGYKLPDTGLQLLGLYRFWNIIEYWSPYRNLVTGDWDKVLSEFVPRVALAKDAEDYQRALMALIARFQDTHSNLWSSLRHRPPVGDCQLPLTVRFIENRPVVTESFEQPPAAMKRGDIIESLDGSPVGALIERWKPYYAASNVPTRLRDIARSMGRGTCGDARVGVRRGSDTLQLTARRVPPASLPEAARRTAHDRAGEIFQRLSDDVAYLKLSSVKSAEAAKYIDSAAGTKGLIIDIRNYPGEFVVFALGQLLVEKESEFARFTNGDLSNPGASHWTPPVKLTPRKPRYSGKVVILVDEVSQSQAEYTTMAFRTAPGATVVGSTTAGADGNVSSFALPGGYRSMITGIGVFYPDKRPTQRIGILSDVEVKPTIEGIRAGRDEVLEAAVRRILGSTVPAAEIERMARGEQVEGGQARRPLQPLDGDLDSAIARNRLGTLVIRTAPGAKVSVEQLRHEFWFGATVATGMFTGRATAEDVARYNQIFTSHFNAGVIEAAFKWHDMEPEKGKVNYSIVDSMLAWADKNGIPLRGHCIYWGIPNRVQNWVKELDDNGLRLALRERGRAIGARYRDRFAEYDLNNEMIHANYYAQRLGSAITKDMALWVKDGDPRAKLFVNDYDITTGNRLADYEKHIRELLDMGVPIEGIGVQGHLHGDTFDAAALQNSLDVLAKFKLPIRITEFNFPGQRSRFYTGDRKAQLTPEEEAAKAQALRQYFRICFAHPAVTGIMLWGFWEGANWIPQSSLYKRDWTPTPAAEAYQDLVLKQWWTRWTGTTNGEGLAVVRAFYGRHRVTVNGKEVVVDLGKAEGTRQVEIK